MSHRVPRRVQFIGDRMRLMIECGIVKKSPKWLVPFEDTQKRFGPQPRYPQLSGKSKVKKNLLQFPEDNIRSRFLKEQGFLEDVVNLVDVKVPAEQQTFVSKQTEFFDRVRQIASSRGKTETQATWDAILEIQMEKAKLRAERQILEDKLAQEAKSLSSLISERSTPKDDGELGAPVDTEPGTAAPTPVVDPNVLQPALQKLFDLMDNKPTKTPSDSQSDQPKETITASDAGGKDNKE